MEITPDFSQALPELAPSKKEMLTVSKSGDQTVVRINSSSLGIILSCMRKAKYEILHGLKKNAPALIFGSAVHKALEVFYSHPSAARTFPKDFKQISDLMAFGTDPLEQHFLFDAIAAFVKAAEPLRCLPDVDKRSIPNGIWILQEYFKSFINDPYVVMTDEKGPIVERTCEMELCRFTLPNGTVIIIILFGTLDVMLKHEINGTVLPGDHKTASQLGSDFYNRVRPNHQYTGYVLLAKHCLGVTGDAFLVNALQVKPRPKTARGTDPNFARQVTSRSDEDVAEFKETVLFAVRNYLRALETQVWPIGHVDACAMYGGCSFLQVCSAPAALRPNLLESKFGARP